MKYFMAYVFNDFKPPIEAQCSCSQPNKRQVSNASSTGSHDKVDFSNNKFGQLKLNEDFVIKKTKLA
jgi:hypothetical protein